MANSRVAGGRVGGLRRVGADPERIAAAEAELADARRAEYIVRTVNELRRKLTPDELAAIAAALPPVSEEEASAA